MFSATEVFEMERVSCVHFGSRKARTDLQTQDNQDDTEANAFLEVHAIAVVAPVHLNRLPVPQLLKKVKPMRSEVFLCYVLLLFTFFQEPGLSKATLNSCG